MTPKKILFLITEDWFFCSHFIERAIGARSAGYEVVVVAREREHGTIIRAAGLRFIPMEFERRSTNLLTELRQFKNILGLYHQERPDVVHQVALKPILYGTAAALMTGTKAIVNAPVGMGYIFSSSDLRARLLRPLALIAYRMLANPRHSRVIFENSDDLRSFVRWKAVRSSDAVLIKGAGVDLKRFKPGAKKDHAIPVVVLVARMLRDKGIYEFVEAAHRLHAQGVKARFLLVGTPDPMNPASISKEVLNGWHGHNGVEWLGWHEDIPQLLADADIACLPSYREGLPKSLIEAAASGLPIVTTDTPGCREVVRNGDNGFLVPVGDVKQLSEALEQLVRNCQLRERMGNRGTQIAVEEFSSERVVKETLEVYRKLLPSHPAR